MAKMTDKELNIYIIEDFCCTRMDERVEEDRFDDSHAIFQECMFDGDKKDYFFLEDLTNVC